MAIGSRLLRKLVTLYWAMVQDRAATCTAAASHFVLSLTCRGAHGRRPYALGAKGRYFIARPRGDTGPTAKSTIADKGRTVLFMPEAFPWIAVVDDDLSVLNALRRTLRIRGFQTKTYGSAQEFLAALPGGLPKCLILDLHMPAMSGLELLQHLAQRDIQIPTIIITYTAISEYRNPRNSPV